MQFLNGNSYSQFPNSEIEKSIMNNNNEGIKWSNYTDKKENYTTVYPNEWKVIKGENNDNSQNGSITIFRSPKENSNDTFQDNIVISIIKSDNNTSDNNNFQMQPIIKKLEMRNKDFKLENFSVINIGNKQTGKSIKYGFNSVGINFKTEQIYSNINNKTYIFSLLAEQKTFEKHSQIFNHMLKNIVLKNN
ncbi:MAG: hypothetical protein WKF36_06690 [Candidatus Nitrosocosmicus sp.]